MHEGWADARRRRWSASRIAAAIALHVLVLGALTLAIDRVGMPRRGAERATTLVTVVLHAAPPPALHELPPPRRARPLPPAPASPATALRPRETEPQAITLPAAPAPAVATAATPASAPASDLSFLDGAATRQAIRDVARGQTLASRGNSITSTAQTPGERLAKDVEAAHKADCMKDLSGMGLLAAPVILAAEAMGKCAHKL